LKKGPTGFEDEIF